MHSKKMAGLQGSNPALQEANNEVVVVPGQLSDSEFEAEADLTLSIANI
jgi:hypothetical protein